MTVLYRCDRCDKYCHEEGFAFRPGYSFTSLRREDMLDGEGYELWQGELCVDCLEEIYKFFHLDGLSKKEA